MIHGESLRFKRDSSLSLIIILIWPIVIFGPSSFAPIFEEILFVFLKDFSVFDISEDRTDIQ